MKVTVLALMLALLLVSSAFSLMNMASGNPWHFGGPPAGAELPTVSILYPSNNTVFQTGNFSLSFTATSDDWIFSAWYVDDWQAANTRFYTWDPPGYGVHSDAPESSIPTNNLTQNIIISNIPEGNHTLVLYAETMGASSIDPTLPSGLGNTYEFYVNSSSSINFVVDKVLPAISYVPNQNLTYQNGNVTLSFLLNKPAEVIYNIDDEANMTATGNSTIAFNNLSYGEHNVTIYAKDNYGVISAPSTISINVQKSPFPTLTVAIFVSILVVVGISIGALLYRRHRKTASNPKA